MSKHESIEELEPLPPTWESRPFPIGDIDIETAFRKLSTLDRLKSLTDLSDFSSAIRRLGAEGQIAGNWFNNQPNSVANLDFLSREWAAALTGSRHERGQTLARLGVFSTVGLSANILPPLKTDYSEEIDRLAEADANTILFISNEAWRTMQISHNNVYRIFGPFCLTLIEQFNLEADKEQQLVGACVALPYLLSSNSALIEYTQEMADITRL